MVADFEEGSFDSVMNGIMEIGNVLVQLPTDLKNCVSISDDLKTLENWADIFLHPEELAKALAENALKHFREISKDIETSMDDWSSAKYFDFGEVVGEMLVLAVGSNPATGA